MSIPSAAALLVRRIIELTNYFVAGRLGNPDFIAGIGLGITTSNITCVSVGVGLAGALDTLCSQAFGNKNNYLAGCYYNRGQVILTIVFIPQAIIMLFATDILVWIGQYESVAIISGSYLRTIIPGVWAYCQIELLRRYLGAQGVFNLLLKIQICTTLLHFLWLYIFVYLFDLSVTGISVSTCTTYILTFALANLYIYFKPKTLKEESWHFLNKDSFSGLKEYARYGVPSMIMLILEFWCFESLTLMAGYLGPNEQGASLIILYITSFFFLLAVGISISASTLVGNSLGALKPINAKIYSNVSIALSFVISLFIGIFIIAFRYEIITIFSDYQPIIDIFVSTAPMMALLAAGDFMQCVSAGIIRAMGHQKYATYSSIVFYWFLLVPLAYILVFQFDLGVFGLWTSTPLALFLLSMSYIYIIYSEDMNELSYKIVDRIQKEKELLEHDEK